MQKVTVHKVLLFGMSIYILCLSVGFSFAVKKTSENRVTSPSIISQITLADDAGHNSNDSKSKKRFGSGFVAEEDDDDSANNLYFNTIAIVETHNYNLIASISVYCPNPRNIPTPPPWC